MTQISNFSEKTSTRVLVVDDKELFRQGLVNLLESRSEVQVVGQAANGLEALEQARRLVPEVILMDIDMPVCDGIRATVLIKKELPRINIIVLTLSEDDKNLYTAIKAGATGYLLKDVTLDELIKGILSVKRGEAVIFPSMAVKLLKEFSQRFEPDEGSGEMLNETLGLSEREREVLNLIAAGATNREIAHRLVIAENTAKVHVRNVLDKLHVRNRQQAVALAIKEGLAAPVHDFPANFSCR
jgi:two-component system NarL family response regulator